MRRDADMDWGRCARDLGVWALLALAAWGVALCLALFLWRWIR